MKPHGNTGNRNRAIDTVPLKSVNIKMPVAEKAAAVAHAIDKGVGLSELMRAAVKEKIARDNYDRGG